MDRLRLQQLTISYGEQEVIRQLSLSIADGEMVSLLGPSGSGKSTLLKTIAGLLPQQDGRVFINGESVDHLPAEKRDTVLIFQKPLLFPYLNVRRNIAFGLKMSGYSQAAVRDRIRKILEITGLEGFEDRRIHQLSGGQQQRVALARGLVLEPSILLLDEPLSSLDTELRQQMRELIRDIQKKTGTTMLFVTHDQSEAFAISDRVCVLLDGTLRQTGTPQELFYKPADPDVARFFGISNMIAGRVSGSRFRSRFVCCPAPQCPDGSAAAVIRPEDIEIVKNMADNCVEGSVLSVQFEGTATRLMVSAGDELYKILCFRTSHVAGDRIILRFPENRLHLIR